MCDVMTFEYHDQQDNAPMPQYNVRVKAPEELVEYSSDEETIGDLPAGRSPTGRHKQRGSISYSSRLSVSSTLSSST